MPFMYSERPGTEAARLPDTLPYVKKAARTRELRARLRVHMDPREPAGNPSALNAC
jgi:tRNA A37 methylthiotransferase MiaB